MRIAHLITDTEVGGAERVLARLVQNSDASLYQHSVISMRDVGAVGRELQDFGVEVHTLRMPPGRISPTAVVRLVQILRTSKPDVLQCWMYHANLLGVSAAKAAGIPRLLWGIRNSGIDFERYHPLTRRVASLGALLSRLPDAIIVNSEAGANVHADWGYDRSRMVVIHNGFDVDQFKEDPEARYQIRCELGLSNETLLIGLVARFDPMKDHETFFRAAALLSRRRPDVNFVLCGSEITPQNSSLVRLIREYNLETRVQLLGMRKDVHRLDAALDIATSSSYSEGLCNAVGEAMSCGVPCVVTNAGDAVKLVGKSGRVVPPRNPQALAAAWMELIDWGPIQRKELGKKARSRVQEMFSLQRFLKLQESVYEDLFQREFGACSSPRSKAGICNEGSTTSY